MEAFADLPEALKAVKLSSEETEGHFDWLNIYTLPETNILLMEEILHHLGCIKLV